MRLSVFAALLALLLPFRSVHPVQSVSLTVHASQTLSTVPGTAVGLNTAVWDGQLMEPKIPDLVRAAGVSVLRYPGGSIADDYHWQTNTVTPGQNDGNPFPANNFDDWISKVVRPAGAQPMVTVNYGSNLAGNGGGDPQEAAAWVHYANIVKGYGVKYWEIGNEVYGNGYYGAHWETDLHQDHSPSAYATNALQFISAMKAQDPSIKVGLVLALPGAWPDGAGPQNWNQTVLSTACSAADFVVVHYYAQNPGQESDQTLLNAGATIGSSIQHLRQTLTQYCGAHGADMGIMVTETNSVSSNPGKQTVSPINALFLLEDYCGLLQAGADNVDWWALHNGANTNGNNSGNLLGKADYGDYGVLSMGVPGPPEYTEYPTYIALRALGKILTPGSQFVSVDSSSPDLAAWSVMGPGTISLVLVNRNAVASMQVQPTFLNLPARLVNASELTIGASSPTGTTATEPVTGGTVNITIPPQSAVVLTGQIGSVVPSPR